MQDSKNILLILFILFESTYCYRKLCELTGL